MLENYFNSLIPIVILVVIFILVYFIITLNSRPRKVKNYSKRVGFSYLVQDKDNSKYELNFNLFKSGHSRKVRNIIKGEMQGLSCSFFDYRFDSNFSSIKKYSVFEVTLDKVLPSFFLVSKKNINEISDHFGFMEKNFVNNPHFDSNYFLMGNDESQLLQTFNTYILSFFEDNLIDGFIEVSGQDLIFYKKLIDPNKLNEFFLEATKIVNLFR